MVYEPGLSLLFFQENAPREPETRSRTGLPEKPETAGSHVGSDGRSTEEDEETSRNTSSFSLWSELD